MGDIGEVKDFSIHLMKFEGNLITGQGSDSRGKFNVSGQFNVKDANWNGYKEVNLQGQK